MNSYAKKLPEIAEKVATESSFSLVECADAFGITTVASIIAHRGTFLIFGSGRQFNTTETFYRHGFVGKICRTDLLKRAKTLYFAPVERTKRKNLCQKRI